MIEHQVRTGHSQLIGEVLQELNFVNEEQVLAVEMQAVEEGAGERYPGAHGRDVELPPESLHGDLEGLRSSIGPESDRLGLAVVAGA